jgi:hypothetical protein
MIGDHVGDAPREYSLAANTATANVAYEYLVCATIWLLVWTVAGLVLAIKLSWSDFLAVSWLSFGDGYGIDGDVRRHVERVRGPQLVSKLHHRQHERLVAGAQRRQMLPLAKDDGAVPTRPLSLRASRKSG